jgi:DNA-binding NarL/FixJ family response regulator
LHDQKSPVRILVLSVYEDRQFVRELLGYGVAGYLSKSEAAEMVIEALRGVSRGETGWVSPRIASRVYAWKSKRHLHPYVT